MQISSDSLPDLFIFYLFLMFVFVIYLQIGHSLTFVCLHKDIVAHWNKNIYNDGSGAATNRSGHKCVPVCLVNVFFGV